MDGRFGARPAIALIAAAGRPAAATGWGSVMGSVVLVSEQNNVKKPMIPLHKVQLKKLRFSNFLLYLLFSELLHNASANIALKCLTGSYTIKVNR